MKQSSEYQQVSDAEFEQKVLKEGLPAVVVFTAESMGGAMVMHAIIERLSVLYEGICFFYIDLNESDTAKRFVLENNMTILFLIKVYW